MITKLTLRNFKGIEEVTHEFTRFDLLVGGNNSGKSTVLQALAIWQFSMEQFGRVDRHGSTGTQVVLPNFTALPVPEFNLLWNERRVQRGASKAKKRTQEYVYIDIVPTWRADDGTECTFGVKLRYQSPQTAYAIPDDWDTRSQLEREGKLPQVVFVPPFSGLEPTEEWRDDGPLRQQVGKAQPGSVLRNLLLRMWEEDKRRQQEGKPSGSWHELTEVVRDWFTVDLVVPKYRRGVDTRITCEYREGGRAYDIIAGGSGFHQALTLLAFLLHYRPTTILLDEPDAHLHVNLQRSVLDYFRRKSDELATQFLIATHAEELVRGVNPRQVVFLRRQEPVRIAESPQPVLAALSDVTNEEITRLLMHPVILYVEGESDERMLRAWAQACGATEILSKVCFHHMRGGSKKEMRKHAVRHFAGVRQYVPDARCLTLMDRDTGDGALHPFNGNPVMREWSRQNIENYLLVPDAWTRLAEEELGPGLFSAQAADAIARFFAEQNLTRPPRQTWRTITANVFEAVDGKKLLFEGGDALASRLRSLDPPLVCLPEQIAEGMTADEIHDDVHHFFSRLREVVGDHKAEQEDE